MDEKEKKALQEKYKEHRQAIWFGEYSRKVKKKKDKELARSEIENAISVAERATARPAPTEEQDRVVILRRAKGKKSINEAPDDKTIILERHEPQSKNYKETKKGLTLGLVFIVIIAVIAATVLGVLLGFLLAKG